MKNLDEIMAMAQNVQAELEKAQAALDTIQVEGSSGGGMVKVTASAKGRIIAVDISPAAFNDARAKADAASSAEIGKMTSGLPLPPGFKLPF